MSFEGSAELERVKSDILIRGTLDWVMLVEVRDDVAERTGTGEEEWRVQRDLGFQAIRELMDEGLVEAGDYAYKGEGEFPGFVSWGLPTEEAVARIYRGWTEHGASLNLGDVAWICNTPEGHALGEELERNEE